MKRTLEIFDKVIKKGIEIMLMDEPDTDLKNIKRKLDICKKCEYYNAKSDRCLECTCFMKVKTKMLKNINPLKGGRVEITHCPLAQWGGEEEKEIVNYYRKLDGKDLLI